MEKLVREAQSISLQRSLDGTKIFLTFEVSPPPKARETVNDIHRSLWVSPETIEIEIDCDLAEHLSQVLRVEATAAVATRNRAASGEDVDVLSESLAERLARGGL